MSRKRRANADSQEDDNDSQISSEDSISSDSSASDSDESSRNSTDIVNCDFEFFDPQKQDFLGIRHLLRQLFDADADLLDLGGLSELILGQPLVGTTVKTDGHEGDPLSFTTVLNLRDNLAIQALQKYFLDVSKSDPSFHRRLEELFDDEQGDVALVLSERIINMPAAVAAPSYKMLLEEIQWANEDNESYEFTSFLTLSRTYIQKEDRDEEDEDEVTVKPQPKKRKRRSSTGDDQTQYFHAEDELFLSNASESVSFQFKSLRQLDGESLKTSGLLMLIERSKFEAAVGEMETFLDVHNS